MIMHTFKKMSRTFFGEGNSVKMFSPTQWSLIRVLIGISLIDPVNSVSYVETPQHLDLCGKTLSG